MFCTLPVWTYLPNTTKPSSRGSAVVPERFMGLRKSEEKQQVPPLRYPGFPVEVSGVGELHAAFLTESRTRGRW